MDKSDSARMHQLLQVSIDLRDQMTEVHELRNILRRAEWDRRRSKLADAGDAADNELRPSA